MPCLADDADGTLDQLPSLLVIQSAPNGIGDEPAAPPRAYPPIDLSDQGVIQVDVQTHTHTLAHSNPGTPYRYGGRDGRTISQHAFASLSRYESCGKVLFGLPSDWGFFYL